MSFRRRQSTVANRNVYLDNRLTTFTNPPIYTGDLYVERNETVAGNLDVSGNLTVEKDINAVNFRATGNFYLDTYILIPAGTIIQSAAHAQVNGWFDCNGGIYNRTVYSDLFNAIGYANYNYNSYGAGDLSFNVPDMRGRVAVCFGAGTGLTPRSILGDLSGAETHTLTIAQMPSHTHKLDRRSNPDAGAFDTNNDNKSNPTASTTDRVILNEFETKSTGGGEAHNNMQPYIVLRYLIKY